ncbi:hypothetical protein CJ030_MR7G028513 [Morella rubra]|uniref:Uncharacterized protein n=1 Tax=Morella rubra TaxID=262757 RepID=A0A6A1V955_9ROSI|nr:hypothetical protein CJ030_MR7G022724 [Morella rubra]KAB1208492.1 hypothetical protein CJ030_MR7G028513 [Morella rubra]
MSSTSGIQGELLEVTVVGCFNLKKTKKPFVCLRYGNTEFCTRTCTEFIWEMSCLKVSTTEGGRSRLTSAELQLEKFKYYCDILIALDPQQSFIAFRRLCTITMSLLHPHSPQQLLTHLTILPIHLPRQLLILPNHTHQLQPTLLLHHLGAHLQGQLPILPNQTQEPQPTLLRQPHLIIIQVLIRGCILHRHAKRKLTASKQYTFRLVSM